MMKKILLFEIALFIVLGWVYFFVYSSRVEQEIIKSPFGDSKSLCPSGECLVTYVIKDGDLIQAWYDDFHKDSTEAHYKRKQEAKLFLNNIK